MVQRPDEETAECLSQEDLKKKFDPEGKYDGIIASEGELISGGATGIVQLLPSGNVTKTPWPGSREEECRRDLTIEHQIYQRLGQHRCLVPIVSWHEEKCVLTMGYMVNGSLKDHIRAQNDSIPIWRREQWVREATEGLQLLHAVDVVHCDIDPKNFLLAADLSLKIADFSGSSIEGSTPSSCARERLLPPHFNWRNAPTIQDDLFGLGGVMYFIMTGQYPFEELESDAVMIKYASHIFPDITAIKYGHIMQQCWSSKIGSAKEVLEYLDTADNELMLRSLRS